MATTMIYVMGQKTSTKSIYGLFVSLKRKKKLSSEIFVWGAYNYYAPQPKISGWVAAIRSV
jgi:hypothetical protein